MDIIPASLDIMEKAMDTRMAHQRVTATNLANIDTPGFIAQKVDFEASLNRALNQMQSPMVVDDSLKRPNLDGNNVVLEEELGDQSRTKFMYELTSQLVADRFRQIQTVFDKER